MFGFKLKEIEINEGAVLYDPKVNKFMQIRSYKDGSYLCSWANYYSDAKTTISEYPISQDYILQCEPVIALDKMKIAYNDGIGWRVKKENTPKGVYD